MLNGTLKNERKSLKCIAQGQAIRTNLNKGKTDKSQEQMKCRMCSSTDETINHIVRECPKLVQKRYKRTHALIGKKLIGKFVKQMESMLNQNGMSIKQKQSSRMTHVKSFGILLYRQTIL